MVGRLLGGILLAGIMGCAAKASVHAEAKEPEAFSEAGQSAPPAVSSAPASKEPVTTTAAATATTTLPAGCTLVCNLADARGRMATDAEARFTAALADDVQTARGCSSHASFTLRFDSTGTLTEYGIDAEENACINTLRGHRPALTYPGPAIARCAEHCKRESRSY